MSKIISRLVVYFLHSLLLTTFVSGITYSAAPDVVDAWRHPIYLGGMGGYGSTTWDGLVPSDSNQNIALSLSVPTSVHEGGGVWGFFAGYEFTPFFAVEGSFVQYPEAQILFDENSLFAFDHENLVNLETETSVVSVVGKVMLILPKTTARFYSNFGVARVQRDDSLNHIWQLSPTFGFGANYNLDPHLMTEIGVAYTAGYGESELNPAEDFIPFLYAVFLKVAYRL